VSARAAALPLVLAHAGCAAACALVLLAAGQPLFTDDAWWHLALGQAWLREGPWLAADPLLFTAPGPPLPASWLADVALFAAHSAAGFGGLRLLHVAAVAAIFTLAWSLLRRASGSAAAASLATGVFAALAAYRLVQLRPELLSILAALALYRLLLEGGAPPSRGRVALTALLFALWANAHGAFLLGPLLLAAAVAGLLLAAPLRPRVARPGDRARARGLAAALALGSLATLLNPSGVATHRAWLAAGVETPSLLRVADEWLPLVPWRLPAPGLPPSPLAWGLFWLLLVATPLAAAWGLRRWRRAGAGAAPRDDLDPALLALAAASLAAPLVAVRFLWLAVFPLLLLARALRAGACAERRGARAGAWAAAALALWLAPASLRLGDWPIARALADSRQSYAQPYRAARYHAHAVWLLADAGLEGNVFNDYALGGFLGFWLAPELRAFANGTLNLSAEAIEANRPLRERRGARPGESFLALLDRLRVDLFFGIRLPEEGPGHEAWFHTTGHLEGASGWIPIFRNLDSALYLRANERNAENLERVARYYEREGVPFERERGFDVERVIREARLWAVEHGIVPANFDLLVGSARSFDTAARGPALAELAALYAALGLCERAHRIDERLLRANPGALGARRRLVWCLLRLGRAEEAGAAAGPLAQAPAADALSRALAAAARELPALSPEAAASRVARLALFTRAEAAWLLSGAAPPEARARRP
jgi:hypothetical protein